MSEPESTDRSAEEEVPKIASNTSESPVALEDGAPKTTGTVQAPNNSLLVKKLDDLEELKNRFSTYHSDVFIELRNASITKIHQA